MVYLPAGRQARTSMYYVYLLKSVKTGKIYKGLTGNIDRRFDEHQNGRVSSTKSILPLELIHVEICKDRKSARELEKYFKSGYGREIALELAC